MEHIKSELIAAELRRRILDGVFREKLPSEKAVAEEFAVARMTAARALNLLCEWKLAVRIPGRGTYPLIPRQREVRVCCGNLRALKLLQQVADEKFPHLSLTAGDFADADIVQLLTTVPFEYGTHLLPLPENVVGPLRQSGRFFPFVFNLHQSNGALYAVPMYFSPQVLAWNRTLMQQIDPMFSSGSLTAERFLELCEAAEERGIRGFASDFARMFLNMPLLCLGDQRPGEAEVKNALDMIGRLFVHCGESGDFAAGRALFTATERARLPWIAEHRIDFDLASPPSFFGHSCRTVVSEGFAVRRNAGNPEELFALIAATLTPEFQQRLAAADGAIPVDRCAALGALTEKNYRDDLFFTSLNQIRLMNGSFEVSFIRESVALFRDFMEKRIGIEAFKIRLLNAFRTAETERLRAARVLENLQHYMCGE